MDPIGSYLERRLVRRRVSMTISQRIVENKSLSQLRIRGLLADYSTSFLNHMTRLFHSRER